MNNNNRKKKETKKKKSVGRGELPFPSLPSLVRSFVLHTERLAHRKRSDREKVGRESRLEIVQVSPLALSLRGNRAVRPDSASFEQGCAGLSVCLRRSTRRPLSCLSVALTRSF